MIDHSKADISKCIFPSLFIKIRRVFVGRVCAELDLSALQ